MKETRKKISHWGTIALLYLPPLSLFVIYFLLIHSSITEGWYTLKELEIWGLLYITICTLCLCIPWLLWLASIIIPFTQNERWSNNLKILHLVNIIILVIFYICAQRPTTISAEEMEENYIKHKNDIETLTRYAATLERSGKEICISPFDKETTNIDFHLKAMMRKANVIGIKVFSAGNDSSAIQADIIYKKYYKQSMYYYYDLTLDAKKIKKYENCINPTDIKYNDSVIFCGYSEFFETADFQTKKNSPRSSKRANIRTRNSYDIFSLSI